MSAPLVSLPAPAASRRDLIRTILTHNNIFREEAPPDILQILVVNHFEVLIRYFVWPSEDINHLLGQGSCYDFYAQREA